MDPPSTSAKAGHHSAFVRLCLGGCVALLKFRRDIKCVEKDLGQGIKGKIDVPTDWNS